MAGFLVTVDGIGGSGKTTLVKTLVQWLHGRGTPVTQIREPGQTEIGAKLREWLLSGLHVLSPAAEVFLFEGDRAATYEQVVQPALAAGRVVVSDRGPFGTLAYQGFGGGMDIDLIDRMTSVAVHGIRADLSLILDVEPEVAARRLQSRLPGDDFDLRGYDFQARVREGYLFAARREGRRAAILDAGQAPGQVAEAARTLIAPRLGHQTMGGRTEPDSDRLIP
jgi:dTMP kinase